MVNRSPGPLDVIVELERADAVVEKAIFFLFCDVAGTAGSVRPGNCQGLIQTRVAPRVDVGHPT